jgi:hypothetical protein
VVSAVVGVVSAAVGELSVEFWVPLLVLGVL